MSRITHVIVRGRRVRPRVVAVLAALLAFAVAAAPAGAQDPFADEVVEYIEGTFGGFGSELLPDIVLGPPVGGGPTQQSLHVVSLGNDGSITLRFDLPVICDGPGPDFTVFENPFHTGTPTGPIFEEYGIVSVSQDGETFVEFPWTADPPSGFAGRRPVFSTPDNGIDPLDPEVSGGDTFDLAEVGLAWAAYVRITDPGLAVFDPGNNFRGDQAGFDLDAIAALHPCDPGGNAPDGRSLVAELFDGDGDATAAAGGGAVASGPEADVNGDGRITAADLVALGARAR